MRISIFQVVLFFVIVSCSGNETDKVIEQFVKENSQGCLVIPNEGCGGCISDATSFYIKNKNKFDDKNVSVVFTSVPDRKELEMKFGANLLLSPNVFIDSNNFFVEKRIITAYPIFYFVKNKKVTDQMQFDVTSTDIERINTLLQ